MERSYERIPYRLRPAKTIQRKMLCEAFRRLSPFGSVDSYRYVGFGSTFFSDFILFHKALGIETMISIEHDVENMDRFCFNRPFRCVEIKFGKSTEILPSLRWDTRTILWLDYDYRLNDSVLADVAFFFTSAQSGSVVIVTVDARPDRPPDEQSLQDRDEYRLAELRERVDPAKVPHHVTGAHLTRWGAARVSRSIITNEIVHTLRERNGGLEAGARLTYRQLFNFHYDDGSKMVTVGGLLHDEGHRPQFETCDFGSLFFIRFADEAYRIEVPNLTHREIRYLDVRLPVTDWADVDGPPVPRGDIKSYAELYRYFPLFAEADL